MRGLAITGTIALLTTVAPSVAVADPSFQAAELESSSPRSGFWLEGRETDRIVFDAREFSAGLVAYLLKEILPDASDEYFDPATRRSLLRRDRPRTRNRFGEHCLHIVGRLGSIGAERKRGPPDRSTAAPPVAFIAISGAWDAFRNEIRDGRDGSFSFEPKVSSRKAGVNLTLRW